MLVCVYPIANKYTWCVLYLIIIYMSMTFLHYGPPLNPTRMYAYSYCLFVCLLIGLRDPTSIEY